MNDLTISDDRNGERDLLSLPEWQLEMCREHRAKGQWQLADVYERAEPFYVSLEIERLLVDALPTFPSDFEPLPPCPIGVVWFERKVRVPRGVTRALAWDLTRPDIFIVPFGYFPDSVGSEPSDWTDPEMILLASFWRFLQQPLAAVVTRRPDRASMRRMGDRAKPDPIIRVVQLRAVHRAAAPDSDHIPRDYSCRWLVRGHWRQQWYPSLGKHQPVWVNPYVKGPEHAPLKRSTTQIFAVTR